MGFLNENGTVNGIPSELDRHGGEYLEDYTVNREVNEDKRTPYAVDIKTVERLWNLSQQMGFQVES
jgi:hypothetical protein